MSSDSGYAYGYALPSALTRMYGVYPRDSEKYRGLENGEPWKYIKYIDDDTMPVEEARLSDVPRLLWPWANILKEEEPEKWDRYTDNEKGKRILQRYHATDLLGRDKTAFRTYYDLYNHLARKRKFPPDIFWRIYEDQESARNREEWLMFWYHVMFFEKQDNLQWFKELGVPINAQGDVEMAIAMFRAMYSHEHETTKEDRSFLDRVLSFVFKHLLTDRQFEAIMEKRGYKPLPFVEATAQYDPWNNPEQEPERVADITMLFASRAIDAKIIDIEDLWYLSKNSEYSLSGWAGAARSTQLFWHNLMRLDHDLFREQIEMLSMVPVNIRNWPRFWLSFLSQNSNMTSNLLIKLVNHGLLYSPDFWQEVLEKNPQNSELARSFLT